MGVLRTETGPLLSSSRRRSKRIALLGRYPFIRRAQDIEGVRKAVTVPFGHLIYQAADRSAQTVTILWIHRPARDRPFTDT